MASRVNAPAKAPESTKPSRRMSKTVVLIIAILACGTIALFTTIVVVAHTNSIRASGIEYENLRELAGDLETGYEGSGNIQLSAAEQEMRQINPDYVAWIRIDGTNIDYPVVRGNDNMHYLKTSFYGEANIIGSIFMDYRNVGESLPHIILYGHNLQQGGMFTDLLKFFNPQFLEENDRITLIVNDEVIEYEIFSVRLSDITDPAYDLDFGEPRYFARFANRVNAPLQATQILTLSTCTRGGSDDARVIIQAYRLFD